MTYADIATSVTAVGTLGLAGATFWLGWQTRLAVHNSTRVIEQDQELLNATLRQANSAEVAAKAAVDQVSFTSQMFTASTRPFLVPQADATVIIEDFGDVLRVEFNLWNYGTGMAVFGDPLEAPQLKLFWNGSCALTRMPESLIVPPNSGDRIIFEVNKSELGPHVSPSTTVDGALTRAVFETWYFDASLSIRYFLRVTYQTEDGAELVAPAVAQLRQADVEFHGPTIAATGSAVFAETTRADGTVETSGTPPAPV